MRPGRAIMLRGLALLATLCITLIFVQTIFRGGSDTLKTRPARMAVDRSPVQLCPKDASSLLSVGLLGLLYEGLFSLDASGIPRPALCWKSDVSTDGRSWTFHLKKAKWSDGSEVTAEDFLASYKAAIDPSQPCPGSASLGLLDWFPDDPDAPPAVAAIDSQTLQLRWKSPCYDAPVQLCRAAFLPWCVSQRGGSLVSNGPYVLKGRDPGGVIHLEPNRHWRNSSPNLPPLDLIPLDAKTALASARSKQIDWIGSPWGSSLRSIKEAPSAKWVDQASYGTLWVRINCRRSGLDTSDLRRAIQGPIRDASEHFGGPIGLLPEALKSHLPFPPVVLPVVESHRANGPLTLIFMADYQRELQAVLLKKFLGHRGIEITLTPLESKGFYERVKKGDYDLCLSTWMADSMASDEMLLPWGSCNAPGNSTGWGDSRIELWRKKAREQQDVKLLQLAELLIEQEAPVVPLAPVFMRFWASPRLAHWKVTPVGTFDVESILSAPAGVLNQNEIVDGKVPGL